MKNFILSLFFILVIFISCKSNNFFIRNYYIENQKIQNNDLSFTIFNLSEKDITSFSVYVEITATNDENYSTIESKEFFITQEILSNNCDSINIDLTELILELNNQSDNFNDTEENTVYINRIFLRNINFSDETTWTDKYGTWCL